MMRDDISSVLFSEEEISTRVKELGKQLTQDYADKSPILVSVLKGAYVFMSDISRSIDIPCAIEFMCVSSYGSGTTSSGNVNIRLDLSCDITDRHILIIEDILDTGNSLKKITELLKTRNPASIKICTLFDKPARRKADITADYVGFEIEDHFIVGYGLDYNEIYRNLPYVGILSPSVYEK